MLVIKQASWRTRNMICSAASIKCKENEKTPSKTYSMHKNRSAE